MVHILTKLTYEFLLRLQNAGTIIKKDGESDKSGSPKCGNPTSDGKYRHPCYCKCA